MSKLHFPTMAEKVVAIFRTSKKTTSIATIAKKFGADKDIEWDHTLYTFDDDTSLEVRGRGKAHKLITHLP